MVVRVIISGRNYDASPAMPQQLTLAEGASVDDALKTLAPSLHGGHLSDSCLLVISGTHLGTVRSHSPRALQDGDELVLIAPVAGG
jgi:molybdopterin converting factor small subunit